MKEPHDKCVLECVRHAGGHKVQSTGDGYLFTFGDAEEAVLCALTIQERFRTNPVNTPIGPLRVRVGIHTGSATPTDQTYTASTIDKAARVQANAGPGDVLVSDETRVLVAQLRGVMFEQTPTIELKGFGPHALFRAFRPDSASNSSSPNGHQRVARLSEMENPYEFATTANQKTFKGRTLEMEELLDSIETGTHTAIFGLQRMGKTSLIDQGLDSELR